MGSTGAPPAAWQGPEDSREISQQPIQQTASHTEIRTTPTHHCHIVETGNESIRFSRSTAEAKKRIKARETTRKAAKTEAEADPF